MGGLLFFQFNKMKRLASNIVNFNSSACELLSLISGGITPDKTIGGSSGRCTLNIFYNSGAGCKDVGAAPKSMYNDAGE